MQVITLDQVKTYLGITDGTHDAALTAVLPTVDAKVKEITRRNWNMQLSGNMNSTKFMEVRWLGADPFTGSQASPSRSVGVHWSPDDIGDYVSVGAEVKGSGIPDSTFVEEVYTTRVVVSGVTYVAPVVELNNAATLIGTRDIVFGFNRAYQPIVAKLAWWMVQDQSTDTPAGSVASKSLGDISVSYSQSGAELDGRYGVPMWAVRGLPRYGRGY